MPARRDHSRAAALLWAMREGLFMPSGCPFLIKLTPEERAHLERRTPGHTFLYGDVIPAQVDSPRRHASAGNPQRFLGRRLRT